MYLCPTDSKCNQSCFQATEDPFNMAERNILLEKNNLVREEFLSSAYVDEVGNDYHTAKGLDALDLITLHYIFGALSAVCFTVGMFSNLLTITYFFTKDKCKNKAISLLYKLICQVDFHICAMMLPVALSNFTLATHQKEFIFSNQTFCELWAFFWEILIRLTVFLIGMLSIIRTVGLKKPLLNIGKVHVLVPLLSYTLLLSGQELLPYLYHAKPHFYEIFASCGWDFDRIYTQFTHAYRLFFFFAVIVEFVIPFIPIVVSCILSVILLKRTKRNLIKCDRVATKLREAKRNASVTIVILTIFYLIFNIPYVVMWTLYAISAFSNGRFNAWTTNEMDLYYFVSNMNLTYTIALNSTFNPLVYIWRTKNMRNFLLSTERGGKNLRSLFTTPISAKIRQRKTILSLKIRKKEANKLEKLYHNHIASPDPEKERESKV